MACVWVSRASGARRRDGTALFAVAFGQPATRRAKACTLHFREDPQMKWFWRHKKRQGAQ